jgi:hypothetical protein
MEAMRALKRRLSNVVYHQLVADQKRQRRKEPEAGPEGHTGATTTSSAAGSNPNTDASDKSLPGPADLDATPPAVAITGHYSRSRHPSTASSTGRTGR